MRTVRIKLFKYDELDSKEQEKARDWWREGETFDHIYEEGWQSLKKFSSVFSIEIDSYDFNESYRSRYSYHLEDTIMELSGQRLATYIWNNYRTDIYKGKYYGKLVNTFKDGSIIPVSKEHPAGLRHVKRYSKWLLVSECPFTGMCYDDDLLDPMIKFLNKPDKRDFKDLLEDCMSSLSKSVQGEVEGSNEDENVAEAILANEYEFTQNGKFYK